MNTHLTKGTYYQLPDGTVVQCTHVIQGVPDIDYGIMCCEIEHTIKIEVCGFSLQSDDGRVMLNINADGSVSQRAIIDSEPDSDGNGKNWQHGEWSKTDLWIDDLLPLDSASNNGGDTDPR